MEPCELCGRPGQRHHIIFRSHGGMNIRLNFVYLCPEHHTGPGGVHNNRDLDLMLKLRLQRELEYIFPDQAYHIGDIAKLIGYNKRRLEKRMKNVPHPCGEYCREDVIKFFMGGKLYGEMRCEGCSTFRQGEPGAGFFFLAGE